MKNLKTKDVRPWWWYINPWLYIKRRDVAYDVALDTLYELCRKVRFPDMPTEKDYPYYDEETIDFIAGNCNCCGKKYIQKTVVIRRSQKCKNENS